MNQQLVSKQFVWSGVVCLTVGSLAVFVQWLVTPVDATLDPPDVVAKVAEHHAAMGWALALDIPILLVFPAVLYVGHLARAGTSLLAGIATALCFIPMLGAVLLLGVDALLYEAAAQPDRAAATDLVDAFINSPFVGGLTFVYLLTHVVGFILLAVALWRVRAVPLWSCLCLAAWPLLEMGGYAAGGKILAAVGYGALLAGYIACAAALVREGETASAPQTRAGALAAS
jgi:hypothetical protein